MRQTSRASDTLGEFENSFISRLHPAQECAAIGATTISSVPMRTRCDMWAICDAKEIDAATLALAGYGIAIRRTG